MPTPCKSDFTGAMVCGLENAKEQIQTVTNFLNSAKSGPGKPGPYNSHKIKARLAT